MPAMYCASAMPLRATGSLPSSTTFRKCAATSSMAFSSNMSLIVHAPGVIYPSMACVRASMPVAAVSPRGIDIISSQSITAHIGMSLGSTQTIFLRFSSSVMT